jgi:hypothetical protein
VSTDFLSKILAASQLTLKTLELRQLVNRCSETLNEAFRDVSLPELTSLTYVRSASKNDQDRISQIISRCPNIKVLIIKVNLKFDISCLLQIPKLQELSITCIKLE